MKYFTILMTMVFAAVLKTSPSQAAVIVVENCDATKSGYRIMITDNQGIGPERQGNLGATIYDAEGQIVGSYAVDVVRLGSISFGRTHYLDKSAKGKMFDLAGPSTNFPKTTVSATLQNGLRLEDDALSCRSF